MALFSYSAIFAGLELKYCNSNVLIQFLSKIVEMRILATKNGFVVCADYLREKRRDGSSCKNVAKNSKKRGFITGFSSKSSHRLRNFLLSYEVPGLRRCAITLTLPKNVSSEEWSLLNKRFAYYITEAGLAYVWRVELQRRKVPHLHLVAFCRDLVDVGVFWDSWVLACDMLDGVVCHPGFLLYGFCARWVDGPRWLAYVAAHTVKHKQNQLGWPGRQWGVVNRRLFKPVPSDSLLLSPFVSVRLARAIRRRYHYRRFTYDMIGSRVFFGFARLREYVSFLQDIENGIL